MRLGPIFVVSAVALAACSAATAAVKTKEIEYAAADGAPLRGVIAWDDATTAKRPGILVVHEWWGHNEHSDAQARRLAEAGYVGFALDLYGKGKVTTHPKDADAFMNEALKQIDVLTGRFRAAMEQLKKDPRVDPDRVGAIGYCFGGGVVLNMARMGTDLDAVATFHGMLATQTPAQPGKIKGRVLALTGADDSMVPAAQVDAFEQEMKAAGVRYQVIRYPGARHGFTNPNADKAGMQGLAYNAAADRQSWEALLKMLQEVFPKKTS